MRPPYRLSTASVFLAACALAGCFSPDDPDPDEPDDEPADNVGPSADDPASTATQAAPCELQFYNYLAFGDYFPDIWRLHIALSSADTWGPDLLGSDVIVYSAGVRVNDVPAGVYDVRVVDQDGDTYSLYGVVCDATALRWDVRAQNLD